MPFYFRERKKIKGMKKVLFLLLFVTAGWTAFSQINAADTVVFDLSRASCVGTFFVVPVSFKSNDVIYAIDFSMKYNLSKITYDSIINHYPASVSASANYNTGDSTLRFTSFCLSNMAHDTPIVSVKFNLISGTVGVSDFNNLHAYLNGDACCYKIIPPVAATIASSGPTIINSGDTLTLIGTQTSGLTYLWSTNATTPSISITAPGIYTVTVTNSGGCSSSIAITITSSPLPVELVNFTVTENNNAVFLEWTTASEINNNYFTLEKTTDGNSWQELKKISGAGNSNTLKNYSVRDTQPFAGINYYRLKQTDFDGTFSYFKTVSVNFREQGSLSVFIYPNPAAETLSVCASEAASCQLLNVKGQSIGSILNFSSNNIQRVDISGLADGIYLLRIFNDNNSTAKKIIVKHK